MMYSKYAERGQTLVEILVAIGIVAIIFTSIAALVWVGIASLKASRENAFAQTLIRDMSAGVRGMASQDWHSFWGSSGLVSYWGFDEGTGAIAVDPVNGNNGAFAESNVSWQSSAGCKVGLCPALGTTQWMGASNVPSMNITGNVTVAMWVKRTGSDTGHAQLASKVSDAGPIAWGLHEAYGNYNPYMVARINNTEYSAGSPNALPLDTWRHIAGVRDGTDLYLYEDGVSVATTTIPSGAMDANDSGAFDINHEAGSINMTIDEVRVYNRALSSDEISALASYPGRLSAQNNSGYWSANEGVDAVSGPSAVSPDFSRWFTISAVRRDDSGTISSLGNNDDPSTKLINYYVSWISRTATSSEYLSRSTSRVTVQNDWSGGPVSSPSPLVIPGSEFATSTCIIYETPGAVKMKKINDGCQ